MALGILIVILLLFTPLFRHTARGTASRVSPNRSLSACPLCGSRLTEGERVHTVVYKSSGGAAGERDSDRPGERIVHIRGCPHCLRSGTGPKRFCPVCHRKLSADDYLLGWKGKRGEKSTVRVQGCSLCRPIHI